MSYTMLLWELPIGMPTHALESLKKIVTQEHQAVIIGSRRPPAHVEPQGVNPFGSVFGQVVLGNGPKEA